MHSLTTFHIHRLSQGWLVFSALPCSSSLLLSCWSTESSLFLLFGIVRLWLETVFSRSGSRITSGVETLACLPADYLSLLPCHRRSANCTPSNIFIFLISEARVTYVTDNYFTCFNIVPKALGQLQLLSQLIFVIVINTLCENHCNEPKLLQGLYIKKTKTPAEIKTRGNMPDRTLLAEWRHFIA